MLGKRSYGSGCAPGAGIPSRRGLTLAPCQPEFNPRDSSISSTSTDDAHDDVDELI